MSSKLLLRRGTLLEWTAANPILSAGEPSVVTDTHPMQVKIGDGVSRWLALDYLVPEQIAVNITALSPLIYNSTTQTLSIASPMDGVIIDGQNF
jgi:hypothetical protein